MSGINREIYELFADYTDSLRDGCIPTFLRSLSREEAKAITNSAEFWQAVDMVRILNGIGFAHKAVTSNVDFFISRVDAKISSRMKKLKTPSRGRGRSDSASIRKMQRK